MIRGIEFIEETSDPATSKTEMPCLPNRDQRILENIEERKKELTDMKIQVDLSDDLFEA
jgi:hypothetical protein